MKNRICVEASICNTYIMEEATIFASYCFEPYMQCKRRRARSNDEGTIDPNCKSFPIFNYLDRPSDTYKSRHLTGEEKQAAHTYILLNRLEVEPYFK